uniref:G_PROTEIN_RECEP_F2_4 domain-containing protein n=1 Tax=Caenorhabditis japonica TaxID=281687 RepID=A0A8R1HYR7_CAEJA
MQRTSQKAATRPGCGPVERWKRWDPHLPGWTNFTMCYTDEVIYIMQNLNNESLTIAQEVARNARKLEFVGLGLSLVSLILAISIFSYFRRLRVFRNLLHLHLMIAMLMVVIIRLVLYIDLIFTGDIGPHANSAEGKTINTMVGVAWEAIIHPWMSYRSLIELTPWSERCLAMSFHWSVPKVSNMKNFANVRKLLDRPPKHDIATPLHPLKRNHSSSPFQPIVCEGMFFFLEYFKTVTFCWMFLEGIYLNNQIVFGFFNSEPKLLPYFLAGYGIPLIHTMLWLFVVLVKKDFKVERCLGSYYLEPEFWILDGPRMAELVINLFFICNVIRVLYSKVRESNNTSEAGLKKSVKAAMMLLPLLGVPNIMQTIPFAPTRDNIMVFAVWTYTASFTYMYQGLMVASIYCFTNKEVNHVLKAFYARYRLLHKSQNELRRGSRSVASHYAAKNGNANQAVTQTNTVEESGKLSPFPSRSKKGSDDSTTKLMKDTVIDEEKIANNNGYGSAGEMTPLREGSEPSSNTQKSL